MAIHGLIFDLDGTVTLTQQFHAQAFAVVFKNHGLTYTNQDDLRFSGKGSHCTFPEFFKEHGITLTNEQVEKYSNEKKEVYREIIEKEHVETVRGIKNFLDRQKNMGMKIAMATGNQLDATEFLLKKVHLEEYFKIIVTNKDVPKSKPAPDIFLKAAEKIGMTPKECIVFEDAVNGVEGAKDANMLCIGLKTTTDPRKLSAAGADYLVNNYDEVKPDMIQI